ncbi:MAG TPA: Cof-type HAD-IIB family hydrolase [Candidatus Avamphibacillus intestinigallinarum]|nr:Cof-type HAD-IIB family hydrolase [Candidatus Avamphibacillus intestinigallinarum]
MSKQIVFFDIDNTLLNSKKELPRSTREAIQQLKKNDIEVAFATGRPPFMFNELRKELNIENYISYSGQYVVMNDEVIYKNTIDEDEVSRLWNIAMKKEVPMIFMDETKMNATVPNHPFIKSGLSKLQFEYPEVNLEKIINRNIYQALLFCEENEEDTLRCEQGRSRIIRWHKYTCDVLPGNGHKAVGIKKFLEASGIAPENSFGFGDGLNDIEMLQAVGYGVAMENGVEPLKAVADYVTNTVDEDGVLHALRKLELI